MTVSIEVGRDLRSCTRVGPGWEAEEGKTTRRQDLVVPQLHGRQFPSREPTEDPLSGFPYI